MFGEEWGMHCLSDGFYNQSELRHLGNLSRWSSDSCQQVQSGCSWSYSAVYCKEEAQLSQSPSQSNASVAGIKKGQCITSLLLFLLWRSLSFEVSALLLHKCSRAAVAGRAQQWGKLGCPHVFTCSRNRVPWSQHRDNAVLDPAPILP